MDNTTKYNETATPRDLASFYSKLDANRNGFTYRGFDSYETKLDGPSLISNMNDYKVNRPEDRKIDLSVCIESKIDMKFGERGCLNIGKLKNISQDNSIHKYIKADDSPNNGWKSCQVRQNHIHFNTERYKAKQNYIHSSKWDCPLPEGLEVKLYYVNGKTEVTTEYMRKQWGCCQNAILGFEVLGVADGYTYY